MNDLNKKLAMWGGIFAIIGSLYAGSVAFFGVAIRPAWAWEHQGLTKKVAENYQEFNVQQKQFQIQFYNYDKRDLRDQLYENLREQRSYTEDGRSIPDFLIEQELDIQNEIEDLDREIDLLQRGIIDFNS